MDGGWLAFVIIFVVLFLCWAFLETHYFLQMIYTLLNARYFKSKVGIFEETLYYGICSTSDIDIFFDHMNNNRYLRDVDFARTDFYCRTRLYEKITEKGGKVVVGANLVIYRRLIRPLSTYNITSKIVYWDNKSIFMEHRFVTTRDAAVSASVFSQQTLIKSDADSILRELVDPETSLQKPPIPPEVAHMLQAMRHHHATDATGLLNVHGQIPLMNGSDKELERTL